MRTHSASAAALLVVSLAAPSTSRAQRDGISRSHSSHAKFAGSARGSSIASKACVNDCDDWSLAVVSAVLPGEPVRGDADYVTVVIENRGSVASPASVVMVAPRNHLSLVRRSSIRPLAPGERTTVQLPVTIGPDGVPCVSITITSAPIPPAPAAQFLAAGPAAPAIPVAPVAPSVPAETQWAGAERWTFVPPFGEAELLNGSSQGDVA